MLKDEKDLKLIILQTKIKLTQNAEIIKYSTMDKMQL